MWQFATRGFLLPASTFLAVMSLRTAGLLLFLFRLWLEQSLDFFTQSHSLAGREVLAAGVLVALGLEAANNTGTAVEVAGRIKAPLFILFPDASGPAAARQERVDGYRDQKMAALFVESEWSQEELAAHLGKRWGKSVSSDWVAKHLRLGRFLSSFNTTGIKDEWKLPLNLTERAFRRFWEATKPAGDFRGHKTKRPGYRWEAAPGLR
ncbi:MAG TPA: hypothetical protein VH682_03350 [Gemmataceae bacterium]